MRDYFFKFCSRGILFYLIFFVFFPITGIKLVRHNPVDIIPSVAPAWYVSFEIFPEGVVNGWNNIIHFTTGGNHGKHGDRIPAVWFHTASTRLHICSSISGNFNECFNSKSLKQNVYTKVEIMQKQISNTRYRFSVWIAGKRVYHTVNTAARYFSNVKVFRSDPWHPAANALIKNLVYRNLEHSKTFSFFSSELYNSIKYTK